MFSAATIGAFSTLAAILTSLAVLAWLDARQPRDKP